MSKACSVIVMALCVMNGPLIGLAAETDAAAAAKCKALQNVDFSGIQDAPTQLTETRLIEASDNLPAHCRARGYITPNIGIEISLPISNWNRKFLEVGCGGYCGIVFTSQAFSGCHDALRKGYACIASDMGHQGTGAQWAYNNPQAEIDYGFRATHVTALAGKAITEDFYGSAPAKSYFTGCSTGGRQGLVEAQRFPWDFDGIVAGAPAINLSATLLNIYWAALAVEDKDGNSLFDSADLQLVHGAALAECDIDDGVKDGVIGNPPACRFDPAVLVCKAGATSDCLSKEQAEAVKKIYTGPTTSRGEQIYTDGAMRGSELYFINYQGGSPFSRDFFRYLAFVPDPGPNWRRRTFDFDHDYQRFGMMESFYGGTDPDLRRFKARGGKLILYHGWADAGGGGIAPLKTVDYYETVEKTMGGSAATQDFLRLFMIPGMGHCRGGSGADRIDYLNYLEAWVEQGKAPDVMIGAHLRNDEVVFTRPVYPYPIRARYKGQGEPSKAENFGPAN